MAHALAENLNKLGLAESKGLDQHPKVSSRQGRPCQKEKKQSSICPGHQMAKWERVKVSKSLTLAKEWRVRAGAWREKVCSTVKEVGFRGWEKRKENISKRSTRNLERVSGLKSSPVESGESWFHSKSGQI